MTDRNYSYLNDILAGDILMDDCGDHWKVVGQLSGGRIACVDEPIEDCTHLPAVSVWSWDDIQKMTLV